MSKARPRRAVALKNKKKSIITTTEGRNNEKLGWHISVEVNNKLKQKN